MSQKELSSVPGTRITANKSRLLSGSPAAHPRACGEHTSSTPLIHRRKSTSGFSTKFRIVQARLCASRRFDNSELLKIIDGCLGEE